MSESTADRRWWRDRRIVIPMVIVMSVAAVAALVLFQPWKLFVDEVVDEPPPTAAPPTPGATAGEPRPEPVVLRTGSFISHEHGTSGTVQVLRLPEGQRVLRIEGLATSNGPDLKVWLTDAPVIEGTDGWFVFDDGRYVDLGALKGNVGNQNYPVPDDVDLDELDSVSIWCARFQVSFGAAELRTA